MYKLNKGPFGGWVKTVVLENEMNCSDLRFL